MTAKENALEGSDSTGKIQNQELDIKDLCDEDLMTLHKEDPFMYYSIPGIRMAAIFGKDTDPSNMDSLCSKYDHGGNNFSAESDSSLGSNRSNTTVTRQTRMSFESDACSLLETMEGYDDTDENVTEESDILLNFLEKFERM